MDKSKNWRGFVDVRGSIKAHPPGVMTANTKYPADILSSWALILLIVGPELFLDPG